MTALAIVAALVAFALGIGALVDHFDRPLFGPLNEAEARQRGDTARTSGEEL